MKAKAISPIDSMQTSAGSGGRSRWMVAMLSCAIVALCGCTTTPSAYSTVETTSETVPMGGYENQPGSTIVIENWDPSINDWRLLPGGLTYTKSTGLNLNGQTVYPWNLEALGERMIWEAGDVGHSTRLRVRRADDNTIFGGVHDDWLDCFERHDANPAAFATNCRVSNEIQMWTPGYRMPNTPIFSSLGTQSPGYGDPESNRCVFDVHQAFAAMGGASDYRNSFQAEITTNLPPYGASGEVENISKHYQSVQRLQGVGDDNWIVVSKSSETYGKAGLVFIEYPNIDSIGQSFHNSSRTSKEGAARTVYDMPWTTHPGGMQVVGNVLAVGVEQIDGLPGRGEVDFFDVGDPANVHLIQRVTMPSYMGGAAWVGISRLDDGRYLMIVGGKGSGADNGAVLVSNRGHIDDATEWIVIGGWGAGSDRSIDEGFFARNFDSLNLVTDCYGGIFAIGMYSPGATNDRAILMQLYEEGPGNFALYQYAQKDFNTTLGVRFRWAAGIHVGPFGNELTIYATDRRSQAGGWLNVLEFRSSLE